MAKNKTLETEDKTVETETPVKADVNPELAFQQAWDKTPAMRDLTTRRGRMRGNLRPSQMEPARKLLRKYGF